MRTRHTHCTALHCTGMGRPSSSPVRARRSNAVSTVVVVLVRERRAARVCCDGGRSGAPVGKREAMDMWCVVLRSSPILSSIRSWRYGLKPAGGARTRRVHGEEHIWDGRSISIEWCTCVRAAGPRTRTSVGSSPPPCLHCSTRSTSHQGASMSLG